MSKPETVFFGKVFNRSKDPNDERKVLSFDKAEKREDGTWRNIKATEIVYEDGTSMQLGEHLVVKIDGQGRGNEIGRCYFTIFHDAAPRDAAKEYEDRYAGDDMTDDTIPF